MSISRLNSKTPSGKFDIRLVAVILAETKKGRDGRGQGVGYAWRRSVGGTTDLERMRRWPIKNR